MLPKSTCSVDGCEWPARWRGWCPKHYQRWWRQTHLETVAASAAMYYHANREKVAAYQAVYQAIYRKANREQDREYSHRRRVRMAGGFVEPLDLAVLVERDGGYCGICHKKVQAAERSIDHILPISKGGAHSYAN